MDQEKQYVFDKPANLWRVLGLFFVNCASAGSRGEQFTADTMVCVREAIEATKERDSIVIDGTVGPRRSPAPGQTSMLVRISGRGATMRRPRATSASPENH